MEHPEPTDRSRPEEVRIISGAVVYFLLVMVAGFAFGTLRELVLVPTFGRAIGEPLRAPLMFAAIVASAWLATGWCRVPPDTGARVAVGSLALGLGSPERTWVEPLHGWQRSGVVRELHGHHTGGQRRTLGGAGHNAPAGEALAVSDERFLSNIPVA